MLISKFNINLRRINADDLELIRAWRNSKYVNDKMVSNEYITKDMQEQWFVSINNEFNYYFIAEYNDQKIGLISIKNICNKSGEGAIYLSSSTFENTSIFARIVMCFNDFVFDDLNLEYITSYVKRNNFKALSSTIAQGGIVDESKSTSDYVYFRIDKNHYKIKTEKVRNILNRLT